MKTKVNIKVGIKFSVSAPFFEQISTKSNHIAPMIHVHTAITIFITFTFSTIKLSFFVKLFLYVALLNFIKIRTIKNKKLTLIIPIITSITLIPPNKQNKKFFYVIICSITKTLYIALGISS